VIEDGAVVTGDVNVGIAVVVVIGDGDSLAVMIFRGDARFFCDVGEVPSPLLRLERGTQWVIGFVKIGGAGIGRNRDP